MCTMVIVTGFSFGYLYFPAILASFFQLQSQDYSVLISYNYIVSDTYDRNDVETIDKLLFLSIIIGL